MIILKFMIRIKIKDDKIKDENNLIMMICTVKITFF